MSFPITRMRRLRQNETLRRMVRVADPSSVFFRRVIVISSPAVSLKPPASARASLSLVPPRSGTRPCRCTSPLRMTH